MAVFENFQETLAYRITGFNEESGHWLPKSSITMKLIVTVTEVITLKLKIVFF